MKQKTIIAPESKKHKVTEIGDGEPLEMDKITPAHRKALEKCDLKQQFLSPLDRITQSKVFIGNVKYPGADEIYPQVQQAMFRFVSKYYPYALGGPLYVDEPRNDQEVHRAYEKQKMFKKLAVNFRYVIIEKDTSYDMILEQLGEL